MTKYDVVIIGSGLGGLLCGYVLGKEGYNVCILEKNRQFGGCLQTFTRDGCVFDTGIHYMGGLAPGQILHRYFSYFGLTDTLKIKKLDEDGFDRISFAGEKQDYPFAMGYDHFAEMLLQSFPKEKEALKNYTEKLKHIAGSFPLNNLRESHQPISEINFFRENARNFIQSLTTNRRLQNVLAGNNFLYGGKGDVSPLFVHALINNSFIESTWRTVDGSQQIADILCQGITGFGGTLLRNAEVAQIDTDNKKVTHVLLTNREKIEASYFISDIAPSATLKMLNTPLIRNAYRERICNLKNTISVFILYASLHKDKFPKLNHNTYHYNTEDVWDAINYTPEDWPKSFLLLTPEHSGDIAYASSAVLMSYMHFEEVKAWENTTLGKRNEAYLNFKHQKAEKLLDNVEEKFSGFRSCIKGYTTSSPLTFRDYTGTVEGSMFGIQRSCNDPYRHMILPKTKIPNLFFTGQNTVLHGVLGVTIAAVATCGGIAGLEHLIKKINED